MLLSFLQLEGPDLINLVELSKSKNTSADRSVFVEITATVSCAATEVYVVCRLQVVVISVVTCGG